jgi:hypothetical protein
VKDTELGQGYKTFYSRKLRNFRNKLEHLSLASLSSLVQCLRVWPEPTLVWSTLPTNIGLGWKGLPGTNALAFFKNL